MKKPRPPDIQVGDPFTEKLLLEARLELINNGDVEGIQDLGAAGLTCAVSEMASRGGTGMDVELSKVPCREEGMTPLRDYAGRIARTDAPRRDPGKRGEGPCGL